MIAWEGKRRITVISACLNSQGSPEFVLNEVGVTHEEFENGVHYDLVENRLAAAGYEEPFVHFDDGTSANFLHPAVRQYLHMPPWVVIRPHVSVFQENLDASHHSGDRLAKR